MRVTSHIQHTHKLLKNILRCKRFLLIPPAIFFTNLCLPSLSVIPPFADSYFCQAAKFTSHSESTADSWGGRIHCFLHFFHNSTCAYMFINTAKCFKNIAKMTTIMSEFQDVTVFSLKERCLRQQARQYCDVVNKIPIQTIMSCYYNYGEVQDFPALKI